jgi:hypothetical protein
MAGTATPIRARAPLDHKSESLPAESLTSQHDDAVGRLEGALAEQGRRRLEYEAAFETSDEPSDELNAYARLSEANEWVATRARWLQWVDQHWDRGGSSAPARRTR